VSNKWVVSGAAGQGGDYVPRAPPLAFCWVPVHGGDAPLPGYRPGRPARSGCACVPLGVTGARGGKFGNLPGRRAKFQLCRQQLRWLKTAGLGTQTSLCPFCALLVVFLWKVLSQRTGACPRCVMSYRPRLPPLRATQATLPGMSVHLASAGDDGFFFFFFRHRQLHLRTRVRAFIKLDHKNAKATKLELTSFFFSQGP